MPALEAPGELQQFTAVEMGGCGLLIEGPPGCGKTSLALALIDRGAVLIGDDGVHLSITDGRVVAAPPTATKGLIEVRNVGIATRPATSANVCLILQISDTAPRFIDAPSMRVILGLAVPMIEFSLGSAVDAIRAEYALAMYGL